jgi:hypothetical protein
MRTYEVGIVPVVSDPDSRNLIGVITDRDIAVRHVADAHMRPGRAAGRGFLTGPSTRFCVAARSSIRMIVRLGQVASTRSVTPPECHERNSDLRRSASALIACAS